jgi:hypothetical protein
MAPTACAANIIKGKTIESALGINPQERWNFIKPAPERQSQLKFLYEELSLIVCDEVRTKKNYVEFVHLCVQIVQKQIAAM